MIRYLYLRLKLNSWDYKIETYMYILYLESIIFYFKKAERYLFVYLKDIYTNYITTLIKNTKYGLAKVWFDIFKYITK